MPKKHLEIGDVVTLGDNTELKVLGFKKSHDGTEDIVLQYLGKYHPHTCIASREWLEEVERAKGNLS